MSSPYFSFAGTGFLYSANAKISHFSLPDVVNQRLTNSQPKVTEVFCAAFSEADAYYIGFRVSEPGVYDFLGIEQHSLPPHLVAWLGQYPRYERDVASLKVVFGPQGSYFAWDKDAHIAERLSTVVLNALSNDGGPAVNPPRIFALGTGGSYLIVKRGGQYYYDLAGCSKEVHACIDQICGVSHYPRGKPGALNHLLDFSMSASAPGQFFMIWNDGRSQYAIPQTWQGAVQAMDSDVKAQIQNMNSSTTQGVYTTAHQSAISQSTESPPPPSPATTSPVSRPSAQRISSNSIQSKLMQAQSHTPPISSTASQNLLSTASPIQPSVPIPTTSPSVSAPNNTVPTSQVTSGAITSAQSPIPTASGHSSTSAPTPPMVAAHRFSVSATSDHNVSTPGQGGSQPHRHSVSTVPVHQMPVAGQINSQLHRPVSIAVQSSYQTPTASVSNQPQPQRPVLDATSGSASAVPEIVPAVSNNTPIASSGSAGTYQDQEKSKFKPAAAMLMKQSIKGANIAAKVLKSAAKDAHRSMFSRPNLNHHPGAHQQQPVYHPGHAQHQHPYAHLMQPQQQQQQQQHQIQQAQTHTPGYMEPTATWQAHTNVTTAQAQAAGHYPSTSTNHVDVPQVSTAHGGAHPHYHHHHAPQQQYHTSQPQQQYNAAQSQQQYIVQQPGQPVQYVYYQGSADGGISVTGPAVNQVQVVDVQTVNEYVTPGTGVTGIVVSNTETVTTAPAGTAVGLVQDVPAPTAGVSPAPGTVDYSSTTVVTDTTAYGLGGGVVVINNPTDPTVLVDQMPVVAPVSGYDPNQAVFVNDSVNTTIMMDPTGGGAGYGFTATTEQVTSTAYGTDVQYQQTEVAEDSSGDVYVEQDSVQADTYADGSYDVQEQEDVTCFSDGGDDEDFDF